MKTDRPTDHKQEDVEKKKTKIYAAKSELSFCFVRIFGWEDKRENGLSADGWDLS